MRKVGENVEETLWKDGKRLRMVEERLRRKGGGKVEERLMEGRGNGEKGLMEDGGKADGKMRREGRWKMVRR